MRGYGRIAHRLSSERVQAKLSALPNITDPTTVRGLLKRTPLLADDDYALEDALRLTGFVYKPVERAFVRLVCSDEAVEIHVEGMDEERRRIAWITGLTAEAVTRIAALLLEGNVKPVVKEVWLEEDKGRHAGVDWRPASFGKAFREQLARSVWPSAVVAIVAFSTPAVPFLQPYAASAPVGGTPLWLPPLVAFVGLTVAVIVPLGWRVLLGRFRDQPWREWQWPGEGQR